MHVRFPILWIFNFDAIEVPRGAATFVIMTNLQFLKFAQLYGCHVENVFLVPLELVNVARVAQLAFAAVPELPSHRNEHVGVGPGPPLVTGEHSYSVVNLCNSSTLNPLTPTVAIWVQL